MKALVSVIVPMYNCEKYIGRCVRSLIEQTYKQIEILVVDDGSTDSSAETIKELQKSNNNLKYFYQENRGVGIARNKAIEEAVGKYLLFVDSDDYVSNNYIEDMVQSAEKNHSELVISGFTMEEENGGKKSVLSPDSYERFTNEGWAYRLSACGGRMYRKEFWDKYHLEFIQEKGARAEDVPITLFTNAMAENIAIVPSAEYYYVQHMDSAMHGKGKKVIFLFPYVAFQAMYETVMGMTPYNSKIFWDMGILKFLAQFEFVIYRRARCEEKRKFTSYVVRLLKDDYARMAESWRQIRGKCGLPLTHRVAIDLFVLKYRVLYGTRIKRERRLNI